MAGDDKPIARLVPARPAVDQESAGYLPRVPWRLIALGALSLTTVAGGYWLSQQRKAEALRAQIVQVHEQELAEPRRRYLELRKKLEDFVLESASKAPDSFADKRLRLAGLRSGKGLYLRLSAKDASSRAAIEKAAVRMEADAISSCLGLEPASARGLFEKGAFLDPSWIKEARKSNSVMGLRVTDNMLANHIRADLPAVLNTLRSDWFMLVLEQGENRRDQPVDAFLWDLRSGQQLLRGRIQAAGVLFSVRVNVKDAPPGPGRPEQQLEAATANDCSIASQIKALAGTPLASVEHEPQDAKPSTAAAPAAAKPSAGAPAEAAAAPAAAPTPTSPVVPAKP
jgi:hypothetical protein